MPKATVTVRDLKNKETCIDLAVVSYKEFPASFMRSTYEFQIVVVSSLSCFKLPSHKESDVVQFTVDKKFNEFEELRERLNEAYSGTVFPPIEKKSIMVNPQKARRFSAETDEVASKESNKESQEEADQSEEQGSTDLFDEEEDVSEDFLTSTVNTSGNDDIASRSENVDFFTSTAETSSASAHLFEAQDLKRELTEEDEKEFAFIPDAIIKKQDVVIFAEDDNDDLLNIGDVQELEQLVLQNPEKKQEQPEEQQRDQQQQKQVTAKPSPPHKPTIATKPKLKPAVPSKPMPTIPQKPIPAPRKVKSEASKAASKVSVATSSAEAKGDNSELPVKETELTTDDIMSYISANTSDDTDIDLFS
ncbi:hypothetical protein C0Q70_08009 [Pomacea canaliculata]|uniref:PX domain-containing protein n=1 Tax=Pomacea canaliculata TaxID=400727 RepID=A0A2T7PGL9_POMCA|nr:hypothetical protein C0Q70_08009 [Pomacea canaliculata]